MDNISLFALIAQVETKLNYTAFRFEPAIYEKVSKNQTPSQKAIIAKIIAAHGGPSNCSYHTAYSIYASSYGATQIMGFNLYGVCGFGDSVLQYLLVDSHTAAIQKGHTDLLFQSMKLNGATPALLAANPELRRAFGREWNGSPDYASVIVDALKHFNIPVKE